jgi:uncharacterized phage protein (TIGR02218 family)
MFGFTDHDGDLSFDGIVFRANSGMSASALQQSTGLAVDNTEAIGALSDAAVTEADLLAGRFDGATVRAWLVNWRDVGDRILQFAGTLGEITRAGGAFRAELRGLTEMLNQPQGRSYLRTCSAILGDAKCRMNLDLPGYSVEIPVEEVTEGRVFQFTSLSGFSDRWFEKGRASVLSGIGRGAVGIVKTDRNGESGRVVELWQPIDLRIVAGDVLRLEAGCDKAEQTCRAKFGNFLNFRGFPHIPGEDWLISYPISARVNDGGSRMR